MSLTVRSPHGDWLGTCLSVLAQLLQQMLAALVALVLAAAVVLLRHLGVVEGGRAQPAMLIGVAQVHLLCGGGGRAADL